MPKTTVSVVIKEIYSVNVNADFKPKTLSLKFTRKVNDNGATTKIKNNAPKIKRIADAGAAR